MLRSVKYGLCGAVLAGLVGGMVAWTTVDKSTVTLVVDGKSRILHTTADTVGSVVKDAGYQVDGHDLLAPAASSKIHNGTRIVLKRGRLLRLSVDGTPRAVWTTAPTVARAMSELGYSSRDVLSVSRSRRLPLSPTQIAVRTPQQVTIVHDYGRQTVQTTDRTVQALLTDLGITLGPADRISAPPASRLHAGETIRIKRVDRQRLSTKHAIPFTTRTSHDDSMMVGTTKVVRTGRDGVRRTTWALTYVEGKLARRKRVSSKVVRQPRAELRKIGTKQPVEAPSSGSSSGGGADASPGTAQAIARQMLAARGWSDQYGCLLTLWNHESGWNVHAANPSGAYGIPQSLPGSKMASAGPDWENSAETQISWGLSYIASRYGTPCGAWSQWQANGGWY